MQATEIPTRVDDPPHILLWSSDELMPSMLGLVVGVFIGKALICCAIGFAVTALYRKFRDNNPDGYMLHVLYWSGIYPNKAKSFKNPLVRRYFP